MEKSNMVDEKDVIAGREVPVMAEARPISDQDAASYTVLDAVPVPTSEQFSDGNNIPLAPSLHQYSDNSPSAKHHEEVRGARLGTDIGRINTREERDRNRKGNRISKKETEIESIRIQNAKDIAKQRKAEGFDIKEDKYFNKEAFMRSALEKKLKEDAALNTVKKSGGGYEVEEYEVSEYSGQEYGKDYEYKSVYD
eukprot:64003_1